MSSKNIILIILCAYLVPMNKTSAQVISSDSVVFVVNQPEKSFIQFLTFRAVNENGEVNIELVKSTVHPGRLKKEIDISIHHESPEPDIVCSLLDDNNKVLFKKSMPYPLVRSFEYPKEDRKDFSIQNVALESADFLIRLPYKESNKFIKFEKYVNASDRIEINTLEIN